MPLARTIGTVVGGVAAGPMGGFIGGVVGSMISVAADSVLPGTGNILSNALSSTGSEFYQMAGQRVLHGLPPEQRQVVNHHLQAAFRTACREALIDIGGPVCFPQDWRVERDVPPKVRFPFEQQTRKRGEQVREVVRELKRALERGIPSQTKQDSCPMRSSTHTVESIHNRRMNMV